MDGFANSTASLPYGCFIGGNGWPRVGQLTRTSESSLVRSRPHEKVRVVASHTSTGKLRIYPMIKPEQGYVSSS